MGHRQLNNCAIESVTETRIRGYLTFALVGLVDTKTGIITAHTVLIFPVVYLVVSATYGSINP